MIRQRQLRTDTKIETAYVQPRAAALWLLYGSSSRWLVPEELRAFLEDEVKRPAAAKRAVGLASSGAGDDLFWGLSERQRLDIALTTIVRARSMGLSVSIEAEVRKAEYQSEAEFWDAALARILTAEEFAEFLKRFSSIPPFF